MSGHSFGMIVRHFVIRDANKKIDTEKSANNVSESLSPYYLIKLCNHIEAIRFIVCHIIQNIRYIV